MTDGVSTNRDLMMRAKEAMRGKWGLGALTMLLYFFIALPFGLGDLFLNLQVYGELPDNPWMRIQVFGAVAFGPLMLGLAAFFLSLAKEQYPQKSMILAGFKRFVPSFVLSVLWAVFIMFWLCLLIVPGIVAMLAYSQAYFILADDPDCGPLEAIQRSKALMKGHKLKLFMLGVRFIPLVILGVLTFVLGFMWIYPYMGCTLGLFYDEIKPKEVRDAV